MNGPLELFDHQLHNEAVQVAIKPNWHSIGSPPSCVQNNTELGQ
jgi:hypothetical protein